MKKRKYTGSVWDYYAEIEHDMGVPLTQSDYCVIVVGGGWICADPNPHENIIIRKGTKGVLFVFRTYETAEQFIKNSPKWVSCDKGEKVYIKKIFRREFQDLARTWSHILLDPVDCDGNVPCSQEKLSRIG